jgi:hypothetical protein
VMYSPVRLRLREPCLWRRYLMICRGYEAGTAVFTDWTMSHFTPTDDAGSCATNVRKRVP